MIHIIFGTTMAQKLAQPSFLLVSSLFLLGCLVENSTGLTLRLIRHDSPESPYYQHNMTWEERFERLVIKSRARQHYLSAKHIMNPETVRARVHAEGSDLFMVKAGIGTFADESPPYRTYFLEMDTGSDIVWTQCADCHPCFSQSVPPFPWRRSRSYHRLRVSDGHPLCDPRIQRHGFCAYAAEYVDDTYSKGILAMERFIFDSSSGHPEAVQTVFGCGFENVNFNYTDGNRITGILGLGWGSRSFHNQIGSQSGGVFSYCLPLTNGEGDLHTFLHFGHDVAAQRGLKITPLLQYHGENAYFVKLYDLGINGQALRIPRHVFARRGDFRGTLIDSGSMISHIVDFAYEHLARALEYHFSRIRGLSKTHSYLELDLCYTRPASFGFESLPTITFHFEGEGADLHVSPEAGFALGEEGRTSYFCLAMVSSEHLITIIGAAQQNNHRFIFDTHARQLHFGPENCVQHAQA